MAEYFLEAKGIVKRFPGTLALGGVDFAVKPGETLGLIGENGAGKSTLMNVISGAFADYGGEILVDGSPANIRTPTEARARGIVTIRQELSLFDNLDIARNIFLGNEPRKAGGLLLDKAAMRSAARVLLASFGLELDPSTPMGELTVAQKQMVEIARALSYNARLIIMDEPTSSLTETEVDLLGDIIADLKRKGVAIIFITHKLGEISRFCERVYIFRDGMNAGLLEKAEFSHERFIQGMVGRNMGEVFTRSARKAGEPVLEVRGLTDDFLDHVDFTVGRGEILGLAGAVGAGRTEIMSALFGVRPVVSGEIRVGGRVVRPKHPRDAMREGVVLVPEERKAQGVVLGLPVRNNIALATLRALSTFGFLRFRDIKRLAGESVRAFNIKVADVDQPIGSLSGGNQQKGVLAKCLATKPRVLLLDDPTRGIDVGAKQEIYVLIDKLAAEGYAIILSSSELGEVLRLADRVLVLYEGKVKAELPAGATEEAVLELSHA